MLASWQAAVTDAAGNVVPIVQVEVTREGGGLVQLFADRDGTQPLGNPFQAEGGYVRFHASGGAYRVRAYAGGFERVWRYVGIGTAQEYDFSALGIGANVDRQVGGLADRDQFDDEPEGFRVLVSDAEDGRAAIYSRFGAPGGWIGPAFVTGVQGVDGESGWAPVFALVSDGTRRVQQVVDWIGGTSVKPETGFYVGAEGFVEEIEFAVDIRGPEGPAGDGSGDMVASVYDPDDIAGDAFDMGNMKEGASALILTQAERGRIASYPYDNAASGRDAETVQEALDEAFSEIDGAGTDAVMAQCRLIYTDIETLTLQRFSGGKLWIEDGLVDIPQGGVTLSNAGLSNTTLYYIYAYDDGGLTLEASTTAYAFDTAYGHPIKAGDNSRTLVGMARTNGSGQFVSTARQRLVRSWWNRGAAPTEATFSVARSTSSASLTELNSEIRNEVLLWAGEAWALGYAGNAVLTTGAVNAIVSGIAVDSTSSATIVTSTTAAANNYRYNMSAGGVITGLAEGFHFATVLGRVTGGSANWGYQDGVVPTLSGGVLA